MLYPYRFLYLSFWSNNEIFQFLMFSLTCNIFISMHFFSLSMCSYSHKPYVYSCRFVFSFPTPIRSNAHGHVLVAVLLSYDFSSHTLHVIFLHSHATAIHLSQISPSNSRSKKTSLETLLSYSRSYPYFKILISCYSHIFPITLYFRFFL